MNVLLTGGAGYIGSHIVRAVKAVGHTPIVFDSLVKGHRAAVADQAELIAGDICDTPALAEALASRDIDLVIHLAALIEVGESLTRPDLYFRVNTAGGLSLLEAMRQAGVKKLVFSSTAAVYGQPDRVPITEDARTEPINAYGASKRAVEFMMAGYAKAFGLGAVALRYFNVAGADPSAQIGEDHHPETHLIPCVLRAALGGKSSLKIYGDDYDTPDGTCVRDYIHVCDLAAAHVLAAGAIQPGKLEVFNLGNGEGFSVRAVIDACREVTGCNIPAEVGPRRPGDPPRLIASAARAAKQLGWRPRFPQLKTIVQHAWQWHSTHPNGYGD